MIDSFAVEGDDFEVRSVGKRDKHIMAPHRMLTAGNDGETQLLVIFGRLFQIIDDNNDMIDPLKHKR